MTYAEHHLFVMGGVLGAGSDADVWQCGIRGHWDGASDEASWLTYQGPRVSAWFQSQDSYIRGDATLTYLKINAIGPDGKYLHPNDPHSRNVSPVGGGRNAIVPPFVSVVTTFRTNATGRLGSKGRVYLPNTPTTGGNTSRISSADALNIAQAGETLIGVLRGTDNGDVSAFLPGVYSAKGPTFTITQVSVGNVLDVQRRRKNKLREAYQTVPVIV